MKIIESLDTNKVIMVNRDIHELPSQFVGLCIDKGFNYFDLSKNLNLMKEQENDFSNFKSLLGDYNMT